MLTNDDANLLNDPLPFFPADLFSSTDDVLALSKQVEQLNLKIEVEKLKRQKLWNTIRQMKRESAPLYQTITQLQNENNALKEQIADLSNTYFSKIAPVTVLTHCYLCPTLRCLPASTTRSRNSFMSFSARFSS